MSGPPLAISLDSIRGPTRRKKRHTARLSKAGALHASRATRSAVSASTTQSSLDAVLNTVAPPTPTPPSTLNASASELRADAAQRDFQQALSRRRAVVATTTAGPTIPMTYRRRIARKTYRLGKQVQRSSIGPDRLVFHIYLRSTAQQTTARNQWDQWYHTELATIRQYLLARNLIAHGSSAPESILRAMYVNVRMLGDIHNENIQVTWHNYLNRR